MNKETDDIIKTIQELIEEYEEHKSTRDKLIEQQDTVLEELIDKYKPVYAWIKKSNYTFTHPTLEYRSHNGPVLGYQNEDHRLIIYNVTDDLIKIVDIGKKYDDDKVVSTRFLVENGHFTTAAEGLKFLENMFDGYVSRMAEQIVDLDTELNKAK